MSVRRLALPALMNLFCACAGGDVGVCGDRELDPGEACDAAGEGCDDQCRLTGATAWTVTREDPGAPVWILDVAVGASGRIAVLGVTSDTSEYAAPWLLALDPGGAELWRAELPAQSIGPFPLHVGVDADDGVLVQGVAVRRFDDRGRLAWELAPEDAGFLGLALSADAVFLASSRGFAAPATFGLRRVDPATGASVWAWTADDDALYVPFALTVAGDDLVALTSRSSSPADDEAPALVTVGAEAGEFGAVVVGDPAEVWTGVAGLGTGDVAITVRLADAWSVRRLGRDGEVRWASPLDFHGSEGLADVAVGADDSIVVVGDSRGPDGATTVRRGVVRALSAEGAPAWDVVVAPESAAGDVTASAAAFGPGFLVVGGRSDDAVRTSGWVRRIGPA